MASVNVDNSAPATSFNNLLDYFRVPSVSLSRGVYVESRCCEHSVFIHIQASRVSFVGHTAHCGTESEHQVLNGRHIVFISLRECWYYLVLSSNIHVKGDKMTRENNPVRLAFNSWCLLSVPRCTAAFREKRKA